MKSATRIAVILAGLLASHPAWARDEADRAAMAAFRDGAFAEALTGWMRAAAAGDAQAARYVGVLYDTGEGVAQDQPVALQWYRRAAALGDVPAMFNVAVCFDAGRGTVRDPVQAAYWYGQAADHGFGRAEYNLGLMQEQGDGVPRDRHAAAVMFRAALRDGIGAARLHLPAGTFRSQEGGLTGDGRQQPPQAPAPAPIPAPAPVPAPAVTATDAAFASAQKALLDRSPDAAARAAALFTQAAGDAGPGGSMARYDLAWCYQNGIGVPADRSHAYRIFIQVAAETDDPLLGGLARTAAEHLSPPALPVMVLNATRQGVPEK